MIYIRTKDGVYELKENMTIENGVYSFFGKIYDTTEKHLFRNDKDLGEFVSQSENLEELCDEFVIEYADGSKIISIHDNTDDFLREHKGEIESGYIKNVYASIWTPKGLIYVAKMDNEGKLVLIWQE